MDSQQNIQRELLIDGYLSYMFSPRDAEMYYSSLLGREPQHIQWFIVPQSPGIFLAAPPPGLESDQQGWAIDYVTKDTGMVIPQQIWTPRNPSDTQRYVHHEQLRPPIFFVHRDDRGLGLSLIEAAAGNCMCLRGAEQPASIGLTAHTQIRINWRGYQHLDWSDQIMTQKGSPPRETISLEKFAKYVAGKVVKFMQAAQTETYEGDHSDQRCIIGDHHITPRNVMLIGVVHVSQGSWMPILQLNDGFTLCWGR